MDLKQKIRMFNGSGSWKSYTAEGLYPEIVMSDGPHGLRKQEVESYADLNSSNIATCFPTASCIASSWNRSSLFLLGKSIALEALKENVNIMLGCGMNIKRSPLCGRNFEYFSEDPFLSGEMAANYVNGMQKEGVGACIKHFACNNQEKRRQTASSNVDLRTLHEIYLRGFEIAVKKSQPVSIMSSYNRLNGEYASHSNYLLNKVLREKWGFNGMVISDWGACIDAPKCLKAGMDLSMPDSSGYFDMQLEKAVAEGKLKESEIDVANNRVIKTAEKLQQMRKNHFAEADDAAKDCNSNKTVTVDYDAQYEIAKKLAEDSAVLLKNHGILPLNPAENKKILVIGELAQFMKFQAGGSSHITTNEYPDALKALENSGFEVEYEPGYFSGFCRRNKAEAKNRPLIHKALEAVKKAADENKPVLFFCGLTEAFEGEGFDRENMELPEEQQELLEKILKITNKVVVVNFSGAPVNLSAAESADAILQMYLCGEACGQVCADLISGKVNPSGKLAETWPLKIEDTPCFNNFANETDEVDYKEGMLVGYRWYEAKNKSVQYPFGFGLSYTKFEFSDFKLCDCQTATVTVKNCGGISGSEVIQLYVKRENQSYKELRGFEKVYLEPGQSQTVTITLDDNAYKSFDVKHGDFVTVGGNYTVFAGNSSRDIFATATVLIEGENPVDEITEENVEAAIKNAYEAFGTVRRKAETADLSEASNSDKNSDKKSSKKIFTLSDSLGSMSAASWRIRMLIKVLTAGTILMNKGKDKEDPAVKITISAIIENPLESLISTSGGLITYKLACRFVKWAN